MSRKASERWSVTTERANEAPRRGYGERELQRTLDHLQSRGDRTATVDHATSGRQEVTFDGRGRAS